MEWNKGHALNHLLDSLQLDDMADVMPIYIGDDRTDEDAFAVLNQRPNGVGILVSSKVPARLNTLLPLFCPDILVSCCISFKPCKSSLAC